MRNPETTTAPTDDDPTPGIDTSTWSPSTDADVPAWLIPDKLYGALKWLGLIVFPALALFVGAVGPAWGWPYIDAIVTTLNALGTLCGMLIGASAIKAKYDLAA